MLFPYGTDAPVYHRPIATISIIAINVLMFVGTVMSDPVSPASFSVGHAWHDWLCLHFDQINPLQWITAAFMHSGAIHLVGNMIFLWVFGLIVEGKIGSPKFAILYLGICLLSGAMIQVPMFAFFDSSNFALGASGAIFGLMAIALIWAPMNDVHCIFAWSWFWIRNVDLPVYGISGFYIAIQFLYLALLQTMSGRWMSSELLHLVGFAAGVPWGIWMLRSNRVDCEGWDLISKLQGKSPPSRHLSASEDSAAGRAALEQIMADPGRYNPAAVAATDRPTDRVDPIWENQTSPIRRANSPIRPTPKQVVQSRTQPPPPPNSDLDW
ncbi:MAG: rhomboid family intramembrane serine protease [Planctomycetota bacterium]